MRRISSFNHFCKVADSIHTSHTGSVCNTSAAVLKFFNYIVAVFCEKNVKILKVEKIDVEPQAGKWVLTSREVVSA